MHFPRASDIHRRLGQTPKTSSFRYLTIRIQTAVVTVAEKKMFICETPPNKHRVDALWNSVAEPTSISSSIAYLSLPRARRFRFASSARLLMSRSRRRSSVLPIFCPADFARASLFMTPVCPF